MLVMSLNVRTEVTLPAAEIDHRSRPGPNQTLRTRQWRVNIYQLLLSKSQSDCGFGLNPHLRCARVLS